MNKLIKYAKQLIRENKVNEVTPNVWEVGDKDVIIKIKKGRNLISCSCCNYSRFVNENPFCSHKIAVILFKTNKKFIEALERLKIQYEKWDDMKFKPDIKMFLNEIENLEKWIK